MRKNVNSKTISFLILNYMLVLNFFCFSFLSYLFLIFNPVCGLKFFLNPVFKIKNLFVVFNPVFGLTKKQKKKIIQMLIQLFF